MHTSFIHNPPIDLNFPVRLLTNQECKPLPGDQVFINVRSMTDEQIRTCQGLAKRNLGAEISKPLPNFQYVMAWRRDLKDFSRELAKRGISG